MLPAAYFIRWLFSWKGQQFAIDFHPTWTRGILFLFPALWSCFMLKSDQTKSETNQCRLICIRVVKRECKPVEPAICNRPMLKHSNGVQVCPTNLEALYFIQLTVSLPSICLSWSHPNIDAWLARISAARLDSKTSDGVSITKAVKRNTPRCTGL
jgi:hypothetical protein